jgi:hypothetical protein
MNGSASLRVILNWTEGDHSRAKQIDAGTAVHRPLEHLQPVDLTFCLAVASDLGNRIANRREIQAQRMDEAANAIMCRAVGVM